jgi:hypothetical protein
MRTDELAAIRADAEQHQRELDAGRWLTTGQLAERWAVSDTTVRDIPRDELPWLPFGRGLKQPRRRYNPADVAAYEARRYAGVKRESAA